MVPKSTGPLGCVSNQGFGHNPMYCTTAPLDRYVTLPDRTPHTQTMTSHSICSKNFCNTWYTHLKKYYLLSVHLLPSRLVSIQIGSIQAARCRQSVPLAIIHGSCDLSPTCGTYYCGRNVEDAVEERDNRILKETKCHSETNRGATHGKVYLRSLIWSGLISSSLLVLYAQI